MYIYVFLNTIFATMYTMCTPRLFIADRTMSSSPKEKHNILGMRCA